MTNVKENQTIEQKNKEKQNIHIIERKNEGLAQKRSVLGWVVGNKRKTGRDPLKVFE